MRISCPKGAGCTAFVQHILFGYCLALYIPVVQRGFFLSYALLHYQLPYRIAIARGVLQQVLPRRQVVLQHAVGRQGGVLVHNGALHIGNGYLLIAALFCFARYIHMAIRWIRIQADEVCIVTEFGYVFKKVAHFHIVYQPAVLTKII